MVECCGTWEPSLTHDTVLITSRVDSEPAVYRYDKRGDALPVPYSQFPFYPVVKFHTLMMGTMALLGGSIRRAVTRRTNRAAAAAAATTASQPQRCRSKSSARNSRSTSSSCRNWVPTNPNRWTPSGGNGGQVAAADAAAAACYPTPWTASLVSFLPTPKINNNYRRSFHFATSDYAASFSNTPSADPSAIRAAALDYTASFDPQLWYRDPVCCWCCCFNFFGIMGVCWLVFSFFPCPVSVAGSFLILVLFVISSDVCRAHTPSHKP